MLSCLRLPECCASGWLGVRGEIAGVSGVVTTAGLWGGVSGFVLGAIGAASLWGFSFVGGGIRVGWGSSRSWMDSGCCVTLGFPPRATGGGISSSLTGFPFLTDVNMACSVYSQHQSENIYILNNIWLEVLNEGRVWTCIKIVEEISTIYL